MRRVFALLFFFCAAVAIAPASTLTLTGTVTQSTPDGTGPALYNPSLNAIADGEAFTLTLSPTTDITGPGFYTLTGSTLSFVVPAASAAETSFDAITLAVTSNGAFDDFSLLACLSGASCFSGNALTANFRIAAAGIGGTGVTATGLDQPHPLDLLEDDGTTDIQASILTYSNTATPQAVTPEPGTFSLCALAILALLLVTRAPASPFRTRRSA